MTAHAQGGHGSTTGAGEPSHLPSSLSGARPPSLSGAAVPVSDAVAMFGHYADDAGPPAGRNGSGGAPLPGGLLGKMGAALGADFSDVRVHRDQAAGQLGAQAFTRGNDIHFAPGTYAPDTEAGQALLGHELAHVVQQRASGATLQAKGAAVNADAGLEAEADAAGAAAARGERVVVQGKAAGGVQCAGYQPKNEDRVTVAKVIAMRNDWLDGAVELLTKAITQGAIIQGKNAPVLKVTILLMKDKRGTNLEDNHLAEDEEIKHAIFPPDLPRKLTYEISQVVTWKRDEVGKLLRDTYIRTLNQKAWGAIERTVDINTGENQPLTLTSRMTPVNESFDPTYAKDGGVEGKRWGQTGLGSMSPRLDEKSRDKGGSETNRTTNLWHSELTVGEQRIFEAFRSGAFTDSGIEDKKDRHATGIEKAKGVLEAIVILKLKACSEKERERYVKGESLNGGDVVMIDLLSDSLAFGDKGMVKEHHRVIKELNGQTVAYPIKVGNEVVPVKAYFNLIDLNYGVNQASSGKLNTKNRQRGTNEQGLKGLTGVVERWIKQQENQLLLLGMEHKEESEELSVKIKQVRNLHELILKIGPEATGHYEVPALIANLSFLIGASTHFNCKSGKDRTGMMDSASKTISQSLYRQRKKGVSDIPSYDFAENYEQSKQFQQMIWESGNLDLLKQNVGGQSLKVADVTFSENTIDSRHKDSLGGDEGLDRLRVLNEYTNIDKIAEASLFEGLKGGETQQTIEQNLHRVNKGLNGLDKLKRSRRFDGNEK